MDLKSSNTSEFTEPYITSSKSTDFIKPKEEPDNFTPMVPKAEGNIRCKCNNNHNNTNNVTHTQA